MGLIVVIFSFQYTALNLSKEICRIQAHPVQEITADLPSQSSPQYLALIHPISANKPILSTLTVGFIPSTTQSASRKHNTHAGTGIQNYTHTLTQKKHLWKKGMDSTKVILFHTQMKKITHIFWALSSSSSICLRLNKHGVWSSSGQQKVDRMIQVRRAGEDLCLKQY